MKFNTTLRIVCLFIYLCISIDPVVAATRAEVCQDVRQCLKALSKNKPCLPLRVPDDAIIPPLTEPFELKNFRPGVWQYNDGTYLSLILLRGSRLVMIDIPDAPSSAKPDGSGTKLTDAAELVLKGKKPKRIDIVYSHEHYDHMGGTGLFVKYMKRKFKGVKIVTWGTLATKTMIERSVTKRAPIPDVIVKKSAKIVLDVGLQVQMEIVGGHAQQDLRVYIPRFKSAPGVILYIDIVFPNYVPATNLAITEDIGAYVRSQKDILKLDFEYLVSGHFVAATKKDVQLNVEYTEDLIRAAQNAVENVGQREFEEAGLDRFSDPNAREFGNLWFLIFDVTRGAQIDACYRELLSKWGCRLAGLDRVATGHCFMTISYLNTDY